MKLALIIDSSDHPLIASRYKYSKLLQQIYGADLQIFDESYFIKVKAFNPNYCIVFGSFRKSYKLALAERMPYILCDHDILSLYKPGGSFDEHRKIRNAKKIIFTSPDHRDYIINKYFIKPDKTMVLYLRPNKEDLDFTPLPKLPGKNLVYIGGLLDDSLAVNLNGRFGYRCYADIFKRLIQLGWTIHLYPARARPEIYSQIGCILHRKVPEGKELFRELSQYTAGIQGFNFHNNSFSYARTCRPNKIWNYLAAGIPTIGINPGNGILLYKDKWGFEINSDLVEINDLDFSKLQIEYYRTSEVIESQAEELKKFIEG